MNTPEAPLWRQIFDSFEGPMRQQAESLLGSDKFNEAMMLAMNNWHTLNEKSQEALTKVMHMSNMPSLSDVTKLSRQIGTLTGKVESLAAQLEAITDTLADIRSRLAPAKAAPLRKVEPAGDKA